MSGWGLHGAWGKGIGRYEDTPGPVCLGEALACMVWGVGEVDTGCRRLHRPSAEHRGGGSPQGCGLSKALGMAGVWRQDVPGWLACDGQALPVTWAVVIGSLGTTAMLGQGLEVCQAV